MAFIFQNVQAGSIVIVSDQVHHSVGSLRNEGSNQGTYHIQNVRISGTKGLFGYIQKPRSKGPSGRFLKTFHVEARQCKERQQDLNQHGEKVVAIVNHARLTATTAIVTVAIVVLVIVVLVVIVGHGASSLLREMYKRTRLEENGIGCKKDNFRNVSALTSSREVSFYERNRFLVFNATVVPAR
jgi:hypothetical protein